MSAALSFTKKLSKPANNMGPSPQLPVWLSYYPVHLLSSASVETLLLQEGISGVAVQAFSKKQKTKFKKV